MKLNLAQKIWMAGVFAYFLVIKGDVANLYDVPPIYMLAGLAPFFLTWSVMPSLRELGAVDSRWLGTRKKPAQSEQSDG